MAGELGEKRAFEEVFESKAPRLPQGIRKYIRRLKEEDQIDEALRVSREQGEKKKLHIKREERLQVAVGNILDTGDPEIVVSEAATASWLLEDGEVEKGKDYDAKARTADLAELYELNPDLEGHLENVLSEVRDEALRIKTAS